MEFLHFYHLHKSVPADILIVLGFLVKNVMAVVNLVVEDEYCLVSIFIDCLNEGTFKLFDSLHVALFDTDREVMTDVYDAAVDLFHRLQN